MYLLYVDDSGLIRDSQCQHCVLAGFAIRETKTFYVQQNIDEMVLKVLGRSDIELHGTHMRTGKGEWRSISKEKRDGLLSSILDYIAANYPDQFILFGAEQQFQIWSQIFQKTGNHWGDTLANFAEVPLFLDSNMSRLIQLADLIAYSIFRKYEFNDDTYFLRIQDCFDKNTDTGITHGLYVH